MRTKTFILFAHSGGAQGSPGLGSYDFVEKLKADLGAGYEIHYPVIENTDYPTYLMWKELFDRELKPQREVILVGHSFGGSMCLKYLSEERCDADIKSICIVAAPFWEASGWEVADYAMKPGWDQVLKQLDNLSFYHSKDDPHVPLEHTKIYSNYLPNASVKILDGDDHVFADGLTELVMDIRNT